MLTLLLALQLHAPADHPSGDRWFGADKVKHFFMGAFVQSVAYGAIRASGGSHDASLAGATGVTAGVSLAKEFWDAHGAGTPSARDLVWDAAGAGTATLLLRRTVH